MSIEALQAGGLSDDVHEGADGELREMADEGEEMIVLGW